MPTPIAFLDPASILATARATAGLSLRALAEKAGTSHATLAAYEQGRKCPNADTLLRVLEACDFGPSLTLYPRVRRHGALLRGEELAQVLELAAQFPARHDATLNAPIFGRDQ